MSIAQLDMPDIPREQRPYKRYGAAIKAWRCGKREVLLCGPANTGKSRLWLEKLHYCADKYAGMRGLMLRHTRKSLTQSAMVTYETKVLPQGVLGNKIRFNTQDQQYEYPNGSIIAVGGLDDPQKVMSSEWDFIFLQEATEVSEDAWQALTIRLRNKVMPYQQLAGDANPGPPTHWLKLRCDRGACVYLESKHEDNPTITSEDMATLDALTGVYYLRYRKGIWAAAEGVVYDEWSTPVHRVSLAQLVAWGILTPDGKIGQAVKVVYASQDHGFTNPGVIQVWAVDGDGRIYLIHEIYQTQQTDDWWLEQAVGLKKTYGIRAFIHDPSEPGYIVKAKAKGMNAIAADNSIPLGISAMQERLKIAGDGRPRFYVYEYALKDRDEARVATKQPFSFEGEITGYCYPKAQDGKPIKEVPVKLNDHSMDAARYMCKYLDGPRRSAQYHLDRASEYAELMRKQNAAQLQERKQS